MSFSRNIEFFKVESTEALDNKLGIIFQERLNDPLKKGILIITDPSEIIFLWQFNITENYCEGMLVRQRMKDLPKDGDFSHNIVTDLMLETNHGVAELTYFIYLKEIRVLALVAGKQGVKSGKFIQYIKEVAKIEDFELEVLLNEEAQNQLASWHNITKLQWEVKVGNGYPATSPLVQNRSVREMLDHERPRFITLTEEYRNPKRSGALPEIRVKSLIRKLLTHRDESEKAKLRSITVRGSEDYDMEEATIELLREKLKMTVTLENTSLDYAECQRTVRNVVINNLNYLRRLVGDI